METFYNYDAPDKSWIKLLETNVSPIAIEKIISLYDEWGFALYIYNTERRMPKNKYEELRVWIYFKKKAKAAVN